uniref:Adenylosuccinate synthetase n=1 Tax=candidate division WOR-3 bacterium TaxID=2052148 RepID=A0A7V3ZTX0_UNCW3
MLEKKSVAIIGTQWGDEGKGKIVDFFCKDADGCVRFQGGPNAGHTVVFNDKKIIFHQLPSGLSHSHLKGYIASGCVIDLEVLKKEIEELKELGIEIKNRLFIDYRCHLIFPFHKELDRKKEELKKSEKIGTTQKGIGPAYEDKYQRTGIRIGELKDFDNFSERLKQEFLRKNYLLMEIYESQPISEKEYLNFVKENKELFLSLITDVSEEVYYQLKAGKKIIFEGAQGTLLDINFGTYPYVTSSSTIAGSIAGQVGIPSDMIEEVIGVAKAYTTRVGEGPFPTELTDEIGQCLQEKGKEFGATTGRKRRCGWFDCGIIRYAKRLNGFKKLIITKIDILSGLKDLKIADGYFYKEKEIAEFTPALAYDLKPKYLSLKPFNQDFSKVKKYKDFSEEVLNFLTTIEKLTGCEILAVSIGEKREDIIFKE